MSKKRPRDYDDKLFEILNMTDKLELVSVTSLSGFIFKVTTREKKIYIKSGKKRSCRKHKKTHIK